MVGLLSCLACWHCLTCTLHRGWVKNFARGLKQQLIIAADGVSSHMLDGATVGAENMQLASDIHSKLLLQGLQHGADPMSISDNTSRPPSHH